MDSRLIALTLILSTAATVALYPSARSSVQDPSTQIAPQPAKIEVVFAVDTTSSMSGLISAAKEKVWSIATMLAQSGQSPEIRIGLVAFRDRGDEYVTRVFDLTTDLDSIYQALVGFVAAGGGDGPESVNAALDVALNQVSWSRDPETYRTVFLVGDAPPHMDYVGERDYRSIVADAAQRGIIVNTIQCGDLRDTVQPWTEIARLGNGRYLKVDQDGGSISMATPFDRELAQLSTELDRTRLIFGTDEERTSETAKAESVDALLSAATERTRARRGVFNATSAGAASLFGERDLVEAYAAGRIELEAIPAERLPEPIADLTPEQQEHEIQRRLSKREELRDRIGELAAARDNYINARVDVEVEDPGSSLDQQLYDAVREQAGTFGIEYSDGPKF